MRYVTFDEVDHCVPYKGSARYAIDWDNAELKYKEPLPGVLVYENGVILVHRNGYRDPEWRRSAFQIFGLEFVLKKDLVGVVFESPDTGERVNKSAIEADILLRDRKFGRVYATHNWQCDHRSLRFVSADSQPMGGLPVVHYSPNKQREAERLAAIEPMIKLGITLREVEGCGRQLKSYQMAWQLGYNNRRMLTGELPLPENLQGEDAQDFCKTIARCEPLARSVVRAGARDKYEPKYLLIKEKQ